MSIQICMILCQDSPQIDLEALVADFGRRFETETQPSDVRQEGSVSSFTLGALEVYLTTVEAPFPWSDLEGPCETSILWKDAATQLRSHRGHIILAASGEVEPWEFAYSLTQVATSAMSAVPGALGVYWSNATMIVPRDIFIDFAVEVLPEGPPIPIWVDFRVGWNQDKTTSAGFTTGLHALGHKEFEVTSSPEKPSELRSRLESLVAYVYEHGPVLQDGDTIGEDEHEKIRISYEPSKFGQAGDVMLLNYETVNKKKRFLGLFG